MSIFSSALRKNDSRIAMAARVGTESEDLEAAATDAIPADNTPPAGESNVTGQDTENKVGLVEGEIPGVEVPGEQSDVTSLVQAEAAADDLEAAAASVIARNDSETVALEAICSSMHRALGQGFGLEALSEQLEATVEGDGEGIDARTAQMVITANDALSGSNDVESGMIDAIPNVDPAAAADSAQASADPADVGEVTGVAESGGDEEGGQVFGEGNPALEAFAYSSRIATESLAEEASNKAQGFFKSVTDAMARMGAAIKKRMAAIGDSLKTAHQVMEKYSANVGALKAQAGKPLNEAAVAKLRKHMPLSGNGNKAVYSLLSRDLELFIRMAEDAHALGTDMAKAVSTNDPESVLREAKRFFQGMERKMAKKSTAVNISFKAPAFTSLEELAALKANKVHVTFESVAQQANQTYTVVSPQEFEKFSSAIDAAESFVEVDRPFDAMEDLGKNFGEDIKKQEGVSPEDALKMRNARRAYAAVMVIANSAVYDLIIAAEDFYYAAVTHAVMLVRASFNQVGTQAEAAK